MGIYNKAGSAIFNAYSKSGNSLPAAYNKNGTQVFPDPSYFSVMTYNPGTWTYYGNHATTANQNYWYTFQDAIFSNNPVNIAGIQEYYSAIGNLSALTMLGQYFDYIYAVDQLSHPNKAGRAIASDYPLTDTQEINFNTQQGEVRSYLKAKTTINNKEVWLLNTHLAYTPASVYRGQIAELLQAVQNLSTWILTGDFNVKWETVADQGWQDIVKPFLDAGYHAANGSTHGIFLTCESNPDLNWYALDNIFTSADIDILNVYTDNSKLDADFAYPVDHIPLIADLKIN